jgi:hypothetical protein
MADTLWTAVVGVIGGLVVALASGLYATGGPAALQRRTIRQEIEIAEGTAVGPARARLEKQIEDRVLLYVTRPLRPVVGLTTPLAVLLWSGTGTALLVGSYVLLVTSSSAEAINAAFVLVLSGSAIFGLLFGAVIAEVLRAWRTRRKAVLIAKMRGALARETETDPARPPESRSN